VNKKVFSLLLSVVLFLLDINIVTASNPLSVSQQDNFKVVLINNFRVYKIDLDNSYQGEFGAYYNHNILLRYMKSYLYASLLDIGFTDYEQLQIFNDLVNYVSLFNTRFATIDNKPTMPNISLDNPQPTVIKTYLGVDAWLGIEEMFNSIIDSPEQFDNNLAAHRDTIRMMYRSLTDIVDYKRDFSEINWDSSSSDLYDFVTNFLYTDIPNGILNNPDYKKLLERARTLDQYSADFQSSIDVIDNVDTFLEKLAFVRRKSVESGEISSDDFSVEAFEIFEENKNTVLRNNYIAMIACSSVYVPFKSYVGDEEFLAALRYLANSTADSQGSENTLGDTLVELYTSIKDFRKPLYVIKKSDEWFTKTGANNTTKGSTFEAYSGAATRLTMEMLLGYMETENPVAFLTVTGNFRKASTDDNSWEFFQPKKIDEITGITAESSDDNGTSIPATAEISTDRYTKVVFEMGVFPGPPNVSKMLMTNIYKSMKNTKQLETIKNSFLYINCVGDIIDSDGLVIVPAAANPVYYNQSSDGEGYNMYTAAMMNSFPRVVTDANQVQVASELDFGKYLMMIDTADVEYVFDGLDSATSSIKNILTEYDEPLEVAEILKKYSWSGKSLYAVKIQSEKDLEIGFGTNRALMKMNTNFMDYGAGIKSYFTASAITQGFIDSMVSAVSFMNLNSTAALTLFKYHEFIVDDLSNNSPRVTSVLPYNSDDDMDYTNAKLLARNMYWYYMKGSDQIIGASSNNNLRINYIYEEVLVENLMGSKFIVVYEKNADLVDKLYEDTNWFLSICADISGSCTEFARNFSGVLGLASSGSDPVWGTIVYYVSNYFWYVMVVLGLIFLIRFANSGSFSYMVVMLCISFGCLYAYAKVIPSYIPIIYNSITSMLSEGLVYDTLLYKAEDYSTTYGKSGSLQFDGGYDMQTASITLYRFEDNQIDDLCTMQSIRREDFLYGKKLILDSVIGLYLEGNELRMNTDLLLYNNPIYGNYYLMDNGARYEITMDKMVSSNIEYFTPYYQIQEGFIQTLNDLLKVYSIPRVTANYLGGLSKDTFLVYSYANSVPFLYPQDFNKNYLDQNEYDKLVNVFTDPYDFLHLTELLEETPREYVTTLWYYTMMDNEFYDGTAMAPVRRQRLVSYVNYQTRKFINDLKPMIGLISDENLIKMISLQAAIMFNSYVSDWGHWLYPVEFNVSEMNMGDVFLTALTTDRARFIKHEYDIVTYVQQEHGVIGLFLLTLLLLSGLVLCIVLKFSVPLLYVIFGVMVIIRFIVNKPMISLFGGYFKSNLVLFIVHTLYVAAVSYLPILMSNSAWGLFFMLVVNFALLFSLVQLVKSLSSNILELGNGHYSEKFSWVPGIPQLSDLSNMIRSNVGMVLVNSPITPPNFTLNPVLNGVNNFRDTSNATNNTLGLSDFYNRSMSEYEDSYRPVSNGEVSEFSVESRKGSPSSSVTINDSHVDSPLYFDNRKLDMNVSPESNSESKLSGSNRRTRSDNLVNPKSPAYQHDNPYISSKQENDDNTFFEVTQRMDYLKDDER
jgi:hypothetical protein